MPKPTKPRSVVIPAPLLDIIAVCLAEAGAIARHPLTGTPMKATVTEAIAMAAAEDAVERLWGVEIVPPGHRPDRVAKPKNGRRRRWQKKKA